MIIWQAGYTERCTSGLEGSLRETCMREHNKAPERLPYPSFYYKKDLGVEVQPMDGGAPMALTAMVYIMDEKHICGIPSPYYYKVLRDGYDAFGFPMDTLEQALSDSIGGAGARLFLERGGF